MSTITFVPTQRGGTALLFDGYRYNKVRCNNDKNVTYWRCSKNRNCPGRAVTVDNRVKKTNNKHNHAPESALPHHHHALLGHHHHNLHQTLQQHQLLHGVHSSSSIPFLSARHAATAAAAAALAAASNHHHQQFSGAPNQHHHQQQQHQQQMHQLQQHHQSQQHQQHHHPSTPSEHHFLSQSSMPQASGSSYHHNILQHLANNQHFHHHQQHLNSLSSHGSSSIAAAAAAAASSGHHSRQLSSSSSAMALQANSSGSNSSGNLFLNQLSDTLRYQQQQQQQQQQHNHSSSANNNQNASDSLQAQIAILTRLGSLSSEPFKGLGSNFNNFLPRPLKDILGKDVISNSLNKSSSSSSGSSGAINHRSQSPNVNSGQLLDNENTSAALAAAAAAIRSLQSSIEQTTTNNNNRSSPISSNSSSNHNNQYVPTHSSLNRESINHTNHNNDCDSRSVSISPSLSPASVDNNVVKNCILDRLDQIKSLTNNTIKTSDARLIGHNNDNNDIRQSIDQNDRGVAENQQVSMIRSSEEQHTGLNDRETTNNASPTCHSPTNFLADYLAGTLKCLFAASGGLNQQQLAALGTSIQTALAQATNAPKDYPNIQEATNNRESSNRVSSNRNNLSNSLSISDINVDPKPTDRQKNLKKESDSSTMPNDDDDDTDECIDNNTTQSNGVKSIESDGLQSRSRQLLPNNHVYNSHGLDLRGPSKYQEQNRDFHPSNRYENRRNIHSQHHEQSTSRFKEGQDDEKTICSTLNGFTSNGMSSPLSRDDNQTRMESHAKSLIQKRKKDNVDDEDDKTDSEEAECNEDNDHLDGDTIDDKSDPNEDYNKGQSLTDSKLTHSHNSLLMQQTRESRSKKMAVLDDVKSDTSTRSIPLTDQLFDDDNEQQRHQTQHQRKKIKLIENNDEDNND